MRVSPRASLIAIVVASFLCAAERAAAAAFVVTRTDDPAPGACTAGSCSLRQAVMAANAAPGSTITVPAGTYTITILGGDDVATNAGIGDIDILVGMTITGAGAGATFVQAGAAAGSGIHRIFDVSGNPVLIRNMTIRNGFVNPSIDSSVGGCIRSGGFLTLDSVVVTGCLARGAGGGIASFQSLNINNSTITGNTVHSLIGGIVAGGGVAGGPLAPPQTVNIFNSVISNNTATSGDGSVKQAYGGGFSNTATMNISYSVIIGNAAHSSAGGINDSTGTMTILRSTFTGNRATYDVGGVDNDGTMTIDDSTFNGNIAGFGCVGAQCSDAYAGGILNTAGGTMFLNNSTLSGNSCLVSGGGILNAQGTLTVSSSTISGNTCGVSAGLGASDTVNFKNTIVANNTATNPSGGDCGGIPTTLISQGYNLIQNTTGSALGGDTTGNITGVSPNLGPLMLNGGYTATRALTPTSPAFNAANPGGCRNHAGVLLAGDQRGFSRSALGRCDIGAFEYVDLIFADGFE